MTHQDFMKAAIEKARDGVRGNQTPFGACIVKGGKIISCEHNVVWKTTDITAHAEVHAIRTACRKLKTIDLSGCVLYSTCEPCPMCFSAIHWARISRVFYGSAIRDASKAGFNELSISNRRMKTLGQSKVRIQSGLMLKENRELFDFWTARKNRRTY